MKRKNIQKAMLLLAVMESTFCFAACSARKSPDKQNGMSVKRYPGGTRGVRN